MWLEERRIKTTGMQEDGNELEMMTEGGIDRLPTSVGEEIEAGVMREERGIRAEKASRLDIALPVDIPGRGSEAIIMAHREGNEAARLSVDIDGIEKIT